MPLDDFFNKINVLREFDILTETMDIIHNSSEYLADLLAIQLAQGRDGKNEPVTIFGRDYYSDRTISEKRRFGVGLGKETEVITNYMTGKFYQMLYVRTFGEGEFVMSSKVPYFEDIIIRSGTIIMELNEEHLEMFTREILVPQLQSRFSTQWNGV